MSQSPQKRAQKIFRTSNGVFIADPDDVLGRGTYGVVYRVRHENDSSIKKAVKTFCPETMDEAEGIPSTTLREINALKTISHPNVMTAEEVVIPTEHSLTDMFVVMELCRGTLKDKIIELIRKHLNNDPVWARPGPEQKLPALYVKEAKIIAWQLLNALAVVHSRGVMHRDLKPVNIMWGFDDLLKLGDFGLARFVRGNQNAENSVVQQTGEVQTMWYRAPEVLLGDEKYGLLVDDWSIGCVIAELFRFRRSSAGRVEPDPLFHGRSDVETLMIIFETFGTPQPHSNPAQHYLSGLPYWCGEFPRWFEGTFRTRVPLIDDQGFDLLSQLLRVSPSERRAARFLLDHSWFDDIRPQLGRFVPWYRGFEEDYTRMIAVDRLPLPRTIRDVAAEKEQKAKGAAAPNQPDRPLLQQQSTTTGVSNTTAQTSTVTQVTRTRNETRARGIATNGSSVNEQDAHRQVQSTIPSSKDVRHLYPDRLHPNPLASADVSAACLPRATPRCLSSDPSVIVTSSTEEGSSRYRQRTCLSSTSTVGLSQRKPSSTTVIASSSQDSTDTVVGDGTNGQSSKTHRSVNIHSGTSTTSQQHSSNTVMQRFLSNHNNRPLTSCDLSSRGIARTGTFFDTNSTEPATSVVGTSVPNVSKDKTSKPGDATIGGNHTHHLPNSISGKRITRAKNTSSVFGLSSGLSYNSSLASLKAYGSSMASVLQAEANSASFCFKAAGNPASLTVPPNDTASARQTKTSQKPATCVPPRPRRGVGVGTRPATTTSNSLLGQPITTISGTNCLLTTKPPGAAWSLTSRSRSPERGTAGVTKLRRTRILAPGQQQLSVVTRELVPGEQSNSNDPCTNLKTISESVVGVAGRSRRTTRSTAAAAERKLGPRTRSATNNSSDILRTGTTLLGRSTTGKNL